MCGSFENTTVVLSGSVLFTKTSSMTTSADGGTLGSVLDAASNIMPTTTFDYYYKAGIIHPVKRRQAVRS